MEEISTEASITSSLKKNVANFIGRNWFYVLIFLIFISIGAYFGYKKFRVRLLRNKVAEYLAKQSSLIFLIKKTQKERFKEGKISGLIYNIRMKKYKEKMAQIKRELPVINARLNKFLKKQKKENIPK
ncbi:hypothetical protein HN832_02290 [archaeon]|jgi:hypothetical protein|nr:hypothetical protein [archaeon]MBT4373183.1 hypothetical protein [archaeon]MBT4531528.1 hypothetical protein [archaeon]MBT7001294.1 hypothetical protein [archaeon]MBT7282220.1 hypothetical protein [archaeon]